MNFEQSNSGGEGDIKAVRFPNQGNGKKRVAAFFRAVT